MLKKPGLYVLLLLICMSGSAFAQIKEYTLKTVFIEKFTRFVEWPAESEIDDTSKPFIFGVIGENPFESTFKEIFSTKNIRDKKVEIRSISNFNEISQCDLLFISSVTQKKLSTILSFTKNKPILTISDSKGFAEAGVLINFYILNNKIRFEINERAIRESGLNFSYLLLKAAKIVNPVSRKER